HQADVGRLLLHLAGLHHLVEGETAQVVVALEIESCDGPVLDGERLRLAVRVADGTIRPPLRLGLDRGGEFFLPLRASLCRRPAAACAAPIAFASSRFTALVNQTGASSARPWRASFGRSGRPLTAFSFTSYSR